MLLKCCTQYASKFGKLSSGQRAGKGQFFIPILKKGNAKECSNYSSIALISHISKVLSKFSKRGFNSTWTENFQMFKLDLEKAEEPEIKLPSSVGSLKKQENSRKTSTSASVCYSKAFSCVDHNKMWKILQDMGLPDHLTSLLQNLYADQEATFRIGHGTIDWFQLGKGVCQVIYCQLCLFTLYAEFSSVQFLSRVRLCDPIDCRMPGFPFHHQLPELTQTHVYRVSDAIQPSHYLSSSFPPTFNLSQHQGLFKWVSSSHQVAKV